MTILDAPDIRSGLIGFVNWFYININNIPEDDRYITLEILDHLWYYYANHPIDEYEMARSHIELRNKCKPTLHLSNVERYPLNILKTLGINIENIIDTPATKEIFNSTFDNMYTYSSNRKNYLVEYFINHKSISEIATKYDVTKQAVSSSIHMSLNKIKRSSNLGKILMTIEPYATRIEKNVSTIKQQSMMSRTPINIPRYKITRRSNITMDKFDEPIDKLGLSARAYNALRRADIQYIDQILLTYRHKENASNIIDGVGKVVYNEIANKVNEYLGCKLLDAIN